MGPQENLIKKLPEKIDRFLTALWKMAGTKTMITKLYFTPGLEEKNNLQFCTKTKTAGFVRYLV